MFQDFFVPQSLASSAREATLRKRPYFVNRALLQHLLEPPGGPLVDNGSRQPHTGERPLCRGESANPWTVAGKLTPAAYDDLKRTNEASAVARVDLPGSTGVEL